MRHPGLTLFRTATSKLGDARDDLSLAMSAGAGNGIRTRDPNLGKVVLYQLSYSRIESPPYQSNLGIVNGKATRKTGRRGQRAGGSSNPEPPNRRTIERFSARDPHRLQHQIHLGLDTGRLWRALHRRVRILQPVACEDADSPVGRRESLRLRPPGQPGH